MNAHINLLAMNERRNPGVMVMKLVVRVGALVAVAAILLYGILSYVLLKDAGIRLQRAATQWSRIRSDHEYAEKLRAECLEIERRQAELAAFSNVQISASLCLLNLARCVPADIQLTEVSLSHALADDDGHAARRYEIMIAGRTATDDSDARLEAFMQALRDVPEDGGFGTVTPVGIRVDPRVDNARDSLFEIRCRQAARRYR